MKKEDLALIEVITELIKIGCFDFYLDGNTLTANLTLQQNFDSLYEKFKDRISDEGDNFLEFYFT